MDETGTKHAHDDGSSHAMSCPLCMLMQTVASARRKHSAFFDHLMNAQLEVLQAFKSVIDQQISCLEQKRRTAEQGGKATRIPVE